MKEDLNEFLPYRSNLDDREYNSLWECYEEESIFNRFKNCITNQIKYLIWRIHMKIYLMKNSKKSSKICRQTIG
jgi:hypothetical protein|nr:MAG TPA: hypothetical protein [Bacteriophage sp.]